MERTLEAIHAQMIEKDVQEKKISQALQASRSLVAVNENEVSVLRNTLGTVDKKVESLEDELMTVERESEEGWSQSVQRCSVVSIATARNVARERIS